MDAPHSFDDPLMARARKRVALKLGLYTHALVFVLVNGGLFLINSLNGGGRWAHWPLLGWGLGLFIHAVFTVIALQGDGLRERMVEREARKLRDR
jgi:hypothetical protein